MAYITSKTKTPNPKRFNSRNKNAILNSLILHQFSLYGALVYKFQGDPLSSKLYYI